MPLLKLVNFNWICFVLFCFVLFCFVMFCFEYGYLILLIISGMLQGDPLHHQGHSGISPGGVPLFPRGEGVQDQILIYLITYISKFNLMTHSHLIYIYIAYIIYIHIQNHNKVLCKITCLDWLYFSSTWSFCQKSKYWSIDF